MNKNIFIFICLLFIVSLQHLNFSKNDSRTCIHDESMYTAACVDHYYSYQELFSLKNFSLTKFVTSFDCALTEPYIGLFFYLFGKNFVSYRMAFLPLFLFFLITVYLLAKTLKNHNAALFSILLILSSPLMISASRRVSPTIYVTSLLFLCLYFFIKSNNFTLTRYSILFGLSLGLSTKAHYSGTLYAILGLFFIVIVSQKNRLLLTVYGILGFFCSIRYPDIRIFLPAAIVLFTVLACVKRKSIFNTLNAVSCTLCISNNPSQLFDLPATLTSITKDYMQLLVRNLSYWFSDFFQHSLFFALFFYSLYFLHTHKKEFSAYKNLIILAVLFTVPTFGAITANAEMHAYIPTFSMMCILIACATDNIKYKSVKYLLYFILLFYIFLFNNPTNTKHPGYNLYHETVSINKSEGHIKKTFLRNFFTKNHQDKNIVIGLFSGHDFWTALRPYVSSLCLRILSPYPIDIIFIEDIAFDQKLLSTVDFFFFEKKLNDNSRSRIKLKQLLLADANLKTEKIICFDNKKLYIFKNLKKQKPGKANIAKKPKNLMLL